MFKQNGKFASISKLVVVMLIAIVTFTACKEKEPEPEQVPLFRILDEALASEQYGVGFRKDDIALGLEVQKAFDQMIADGTAAKISIDRFRKDYLLKNQPFLKENTAPAGDLSFEKVKEKGELIVGGDISTRPMFYLTTGEYRGFDVELALEVGKRLDIPVTFKGIEWENKEKELNEGNIDCIWSGLSITDTRLKAMFFGKAYMANRSVIMVKGDSPVKKISDLAGKVVGAQLGSSHLEALEKNPVYPKITRVITPPNTFSLFYELKSGAIDAIVIDEISWEAIIAYFLE